MLTRLLYGYILYNPKDSDYRHCTPFCVMTDSHGSHLQLTLHV